MKIKRHNAAVRFTHWVTAVSIFVLLFTGIGQMPVYKRYYVDQIPGLAWSSNFLSTLNMHYIAALVLVFISVYYVTYLLYSKKWDIIPRKGDFKESILIFASMLGLAQEPDNDKYLAEQRLAFVVTAFSIMALIVTGILKVYKNMPGVYFSTGTVFWLAQIHNLFTVILLLSIFVHLLAFLIKDNRPLVASMFTGNIDRDYVIHRHSKWWEKLTKGQNMAAASTVSAGHQEKVITVGEGHADGWRYGMDHKQMKLENPIRLAELKPLETLKKIGLQDDQLVCDIGAGTGIFTIPAAHITRKKVYAVDINDEMLTIISRKAAAEGLDNIESMNLTDGHFQIMDHSIDIALLVTVLHEIDNSGLLLGEIKRILKTDGRIAVIEFHKRETEMGPPIGRRLGKDQVKAMLRLTGFEVQEEFDLGDNFYCLVFQLEPREPESAAQ